jgi:hypothetical protein
MATRSKEAALAFRAHSGWAMLVGVAGPRPKPSVVFRRRVELSRRVPRQPFHAAEGRSFPEAERLIQRALDESGTLAERAVADAAEELRAGGHEVVGCGLLVAGGRVLPELRAILASHALIHAAEGELFRDVLRAAARKADLPLIEVKEKELDAQAPRLLRRTSAELQAQLAAWGKELGPPWTQDEKRAALLGWISLAARPS